MCVCVCIYVCVHAFFCFSFKDESVLLDLDAFYLRVRKRKLKIQILFFFFVTSTLFVSAQLIFNGNEQKCCLRSTFSLLFCFFFFFSEQSFIIIIIIITLLSCWPFTTMITGLSLLSLLLVFLISNSLFLCCHMLLYSFNSEVQLWFEHKLTFYSKKHALADLFTFFFLECFFFLLFPCIMETGKWSTRCVALHLSPQRDLDVHRHYTSRRRTAVKILHVAFYCFYVQPLLLACLSFNSS